jgi:hypothetical protein
VTPDVLQKPHVPLVELADAIAGFLFNARNVLLRAIGTPVWCVEAWGEGYASGLFLPSQVMSAKRRQRTLKWCHHHSFPSNIGYRQLSWRPRSVAFSINTRIIEWEAFMDASQPKKKRLALFLDGTWNEEGDNTSVWRLRSLCAPSDASGTVQFIYYDTGLGTHVGEKLRGGLYGFGIDDHVKKAYEWLVENYNAGDEIFIFGFSRGAFTARCLAGLISICGIVRPGTPLARIMQRRLAGVV